VYVLDACYCDFKNCRMEFDINAKNGLEQTALHVASKSGHSDVVKLLLDNNANDSIVDKTM